MPTIAIECPAELLGPTGQTQGELEKLAQEAFLVPLYELASFPRAAPQPFCTCLGGTFSTCSAATASRSLTKR